MNTTVLEKIRSSLEEILRNIAGAQGADVVTLFAFDSDRALFYMPLAHGLDHPGTFVDPRMRPTLWRAVGKVIQEGCAVTANCTEIDPLFSGAFCRRERIVSAAGFPLMHGERRVGVLFVNYRRPHEFGVDQLRGIEAMVVRAADVFARQGVLQLLREQEPASSRPEEEQTLDAIVNLASALEIPAAVWLVDDEGGLRVVASTGLSPDYGKGARGRIGDGSFAALVAEGGGPLESQDVLNDRRFHDPVTARRDRLQGLLALPVIVTGRVGGVIEAFTFDSKRWDPRHREVIQRMAELAGFALENTQRSWEARSLAEMVGLLSRDLDPTRAMGIVQQVAAKMTRAASAAILIRDEETGEFACFGGEGGLGETLRHGELIKGVLDGGEVRIPYAKINGVDAGLLNQGINSVVGVPIQSGGYTIGALFSLGRRTAQFTAHHEQILRTLAEHASVALGWARVVLSASAQIESAAEDFYGQDRVLEELGEAVCRKFGFEFFAVQLVRSSDRIIETVAASGVAKSWRNRARHYLDSDTELRDIQAELVLNPRVEVISGWDRRFDRWIYTAFNQSTLCRLFIPLVVVRDATGKVIEGWAESAGDGAWSIRDTEVVFGEDSMHMVMEMPLPASGGELTWEVIGTIELGFASPRAVEKAMAMSVARQVCSEAPKFYRTQLEFVLEAVLERVRALVQGELASLHFDWDEKREQFKHNVHFGMSSRHLADNPPRPHELGRLAMDRGKPECVSARIERADGIKLNPAVRESGINALAAIPFRGPKAGVLYVGLRRDHRFTEEELGLLSFFANWAGDFVRHAVTYREMRERGRLLLSLHDVIRSLVPMMSQGDLLGDIAANTLNLLGCDVVAIYEYDSESQNFLTPPQIAGRLVRERSMQGKIGPDDIPALLVKGGEDVFEGDCQSGALFNPRLRPAREGDPFVVRERICSSAGILLKVAEEIVGVMFINYRRPHTFPEQQRKMIEEIIAPAAALAVKNRRMLALGALDRRLIAPADLSELLMSVVERAVKITRASVGELWIFDDVGAKLAVTARYPWSGGDLGEAMTSRALVEKALEDGQSILISDGRPGSLGSGRMKSELCLLLPAVGGRAPGALSIAHPERGVLSPNYLLSELAMHAVIAIKAAADRRQLQTARLLSAFGDFAESLLHTHRNTFGQIKMHALDLGRGDLTVEQVRWRASELARLATVVGEATSQLKAWVLTEDVVVNLREIVREAVARLEALSKEAGVALEFVLPKDSCCVEGGREQITEVVYNLAKNAVEACGELEEGGGRVKVSVSVATRLGVRSAELVVEDNGPGIGKEDLHRVHELGFTTKEGAHLGFGLWWSKNYVERAKGTLKIESIQRLWTCLTVRLPAHDAPEGLRVHFEDGGG